MVAEQLRQAGCRPSAILLEPVGRNAAPAIAVAALRAAPAGVLTSPEPARNIDIFQNKETPARTRAERQPRPAQVPVAAFPRRKISGGASILSISRFHR